jgi:hypothetical protein
MLSNDQTQYLAWYTSLARFVPPDSLPPPPERTLDEKRAEVEQLAALAGIERQELVKQ